MSPTPPACVKPNRPAPTTAKAPRKKRDRRHNTSRFREMPTQVIPHALDSRPDCHYGLQGHSLDYTRQIVEIPAPQPVTIIEHRVFKRWCLPYQRWHSPCLDLHGQVLGQGRMGVRLISLLAYLRTTLRLPVRLIRTDLATMHHLTLSADAIAGLLHRPRDQLEPAVEALKTQARASPVLHGDETGWR